MLSIDLAINRNVSTNITITLNRNDTGVVRNKLKILTGCVGARKGPLTWLGVWGRLGPHPLELLIWPGMQQISFLTTNLH